MDINKLTDTQIRLLLILALWDVVWKGFALWRAARNYHQNWFMILILVNTIGILPIIYLLTHKAQNSESE